eukprot:6214819-Pleurochrysis_carterae.AAC.1
MEQRPQARASGGGESRNMLPTAHGRAYGFGRQQGEGRRSHDLGQCMRARAWRRGFRRGLGGIGVDSMEVGGEGAAARVMWRRGARVERRG